MKNAKTITALSFIFILLFFQNCIGKSTAKAAQPDVNQAATTTVEKIPVAVGELRKVLYRVNDTRLMKTDTHEYTLKTTRNYEIDMSTSRVRQSWDDDGERINPNEFNCLNKKLVAKIAKVITDSQLCRTEIYRSNLACTQVVRPAFAEITTKKDTFKIISGNDACSTTAENVCGDGAKTFREILMSIDWEKELTPCRR